MTGPRARMIVSPEPGEGSLAKAGSMLATRSDALAEVDRLLREPETLAAAFTEIDRLLGKCERLIMIVRYAGQSPKAETRAHNATDALRSARGELRVLADAEIEEQRSRCALLADNERVR